MPSAASSNRSNIIDMVLIGVIVVAIGKGFYDSSTLKGIESKLENLDKRVGRLESTWQDHMNYHLNGQGGK